MNDIGCKKKNLKKRHVGCPAVGWNFAHGIIVKKLSDVFLYSSSWPVEKIYPPRSEFEVGNKDMVDIIFEFEKFQLLEFFRIFRNRTSYYHKPMFLFPSPVNLFPEFSYFPTIANRLKSTSVGSGFDMRILFYSNHISASSSVEKTNHWASMVSWVHPKSNTGSCNSCGNFFQTCFDERNGSGGTSSIAGP